MCVLRAAVLFSADRDHSKDAESRGSGREKEREALRITDTVYVTQSRCSKLRSWLRFYTYKVQPVPELSGIESREKWT